MTMTDDQQFCLRWNNFQANITSQFETLRDEEDFTDVTIACEGQRIQAHKVVLSACSPFFKELFKSNPCSHPIIFMRDVEACHVVSLMEFMYAGQVNVAQAHLSTFLKTAESLKIRGLTDTSDSFLNKESDSLYIDPQSNNKITTEVEKSQISSTNNVTSSQDVPDLQNVSSPPSKKSKSEPDISNQPKANGNLFEIDDNGHDEMPNNCWQPKDELPDYLSDVEEDKEDTDLLPKFPGSAELNELPGNMEIFPRSSVYRTKEIKQEPLTQGVRRRRSSEYFSSNSANHSEGLIDDSAEIASFLGSKYDGERRNRLIQLADGIEIYEDQLRSVKWSDYRKLTRGLATILFSTAELATCSVTGQRWSRAGSGERPVKPALDRAKVQAIISYVATRFPLVEISRIKQVLAYKCKENSTALKMKAVRYYSNPLSQ